MSVDDHGRPCCPHVASGPAITGSANVQINGRKALRVGDFGTHSSCCGAERWESDGGAPAVLINGRKAHRVRDVDDHCGGQGYLAEGSANVLVGNYSKDAHRRKPGVKVRLVWPDGTPLPDLDYGLDGKEQRNGKLSDGLIDERATVDGKFRLTLQGLLYPIRMR